MHLLIFGMGYTASRLAARLIGDGWRITATSRSGAAGTIALDDAAVGAAIAEATHILSSVPPAGGVDPVLARWEAELRTARTPWLGYLSSTGVYGDTGGAWVDESADLAGRRTDRIAADRAWQTLPNIHIFRLPGIYGPGRSALDQVRAGTAHRVDAPGQRFSRIHVDDIGSAIAASFKRDSGIYNLADDEPVAGRTVVEYACDLLGRPYPPLIAADSPELSAMARGFYTGSRVVTARRAQRELGFSPTFTDYRSGLRACLAAGDGGHRPL